jgi:hypothetical protein
MGKDKIALAVCFCLIVALVGFSAWLYVGAKGLESKVSDLQTKTDNLEAQNAEFSTKVQNLNWTLGNLTSGEGFTFTKTDQFNIASMTFFGTSGVANNAINMTIQNTGSTSWTLTNTAQVNSVTGLTVISIGNRNALNCTNGRSINISITNVGWVSGNQYSVTLLLTDGNKITYVANAP